MYHDGLILNGNSEFLHHSCEYALLRTIKAVLGVIGISQYKKVWIKQDRLRLKWKDSTLTHFMDVSFYTNENCHYSHALGQAEISLQ